MDLAQYTELVEKVLQVPSLAAQVECHMEPDVLNLATPNWKEQLENCHKYQDMMHKAQSMYGSERISANGLFRCQNLYDPLKVLLIGRCFAPKKDEKFNNKDQRFFFLIQNSPVLNMLVNALNSDVDTNNVLISDTIRVNFESCNIFCRYCSQASQQMKLVGLNPQPCILNTAIYDGKNVVNRFASQTHGLYGANCIAIVKLKINSRYFYKHGGIEKDAVRIGGEGLHSIAFPESNLIVSTLCLGDFTTVYELAEATPRNSNKRELEDVEEIMPSKIQKVEGGTNVVSEELSGRMVYQLEEGKSTHKESNKRELEDVEEIIYNKIQKVEEETKVVSEELVEIP